MSGAILVINAGSSSIKFSLFSVEPAAGFTLKLKGQVEGIGTRPHFIAHAAGQVLAEQHWSAEAMDREALLEYLLNWIRSSLGESPLRAVGHRVVFGGEHYRAPVRVNAEVMTRLTELIPLMPLHLPANLAPIEAIGRINPALPQVACFDTAFHHTIPRLAQLYALPRIFHFNLHGAHHQRPGLAWWQLPDYQSKSGMGFQGKWLPALLAQLKGPIPEPRLRAL